MQTEDFEDLYDTAPCGYLSLAADGRIALANERIASWTGFAKSELTDKRIHDLLSVPAHIFYETHVSPLLRMQGFVDEVAMTFVTREGVKLQCLVNAAERRSETGGLLFTRLTIFNATERRRYERSLVDAAKSKELGAEAERENSHLREQFIAVLGHDLRNPIASISSGISLLANRERISEKGQAILKLMQGSVNRASDLIDNVLDFARGRLGGGITLTRNADAALTPVLEQVVDELALVSPGQVIIAEFAIEEPIDCDRTRIAQLLSNLLGNALTHGAAGEPVIVNGKSGGDRLSISVANGGEPIGEAAKEKLFQPFFRGDHRPSQMGLGLGLHIASEIAKAHGGMLTVESDKIKTCFTFSMPLVPVIGAV